MKTLSTALKTSLVAGGFQSYHLLEITFDSTIFYLTDRDLDVVYNGNTYIAGFIEEIDDYEQSSQPTISETDIVLSTADNTFRVLALQGKWTHRPVTLYLQHYENGQLIDTRTRFKGYISSFKDQPEKEQISFTAASQWADFEKVNGLLTNEKSQSRFYPADRAFRHASDAIKAVPWGIESQQSSNYGGGNGDRFDPPLLP